MIRLHAFTCGEVGVDPTVPDRSKSVNPLAFTGVLRNPAQRIWLPVKAFLIEHPKGLVLVDAGWNRTVREHPVDALTFPLWFASKPRLPRGQAIDEQLAQLGIAPSDLDYVLMTHLDVDHVSGLPLVRDARHIMASAQEIEESASPDVRYEPRLWRGVGIEPMPLAPDSEAPFDQSWDVFGDGTVLAFLMPGHTAGSVVVQLTGRNGFALVVGDVGYNARSWDELRLPGPVWDRTKMGFGLGWVAGMREDPSCLGVFAAHDAGETRTYLEI